MVNKCMQLEHQQKVFKSMQQKHFLFFFFVPNSPHCHSLQAGNSQD